MYREAAECHYDYFNGIGSVWKGFSFLFLKKYYLKQSLSWSSIKPHKENWIQVLQLRGSGHILRCKWSEDWDVFNLKNNIKKYVHVYEKQKWKTVI